MKQGLLLAQVLEKRNIVYEGFKIYQENSEEPWSPHTNGLYGFLLTLLRSSIKYIMESPLERTYEYWHLILSDLNRITNEVPRKTKLKIDKLINLLNRYDNFMVYVDAESKVKHHHRGGNTMRYRSRILGERNKQLVELDKKLSKPQKLGKLDQELFILQD